MAKKKAGKVIPMLSPENYIRKRSRDLPIWECMIGSNWKESGMTNVIVARRHSNGNITFCSYLVDLLCLGVKDTMFLFNIPNFKYEEIKERQKEGIDLIAVDYTLAHNIIFSAVGYAEDFGFEPHKDFTSVTQYHLLEDNDDVELIDIECGMDGKPCYFRGPNDDDGTVNRIIAQLERTAGPGNYNFVIGDGDEWPDREEDEAWTEDDRETYEEDRAEFFSLLSKLENLDKEEARRLHDLTELFFEDLIDPEMVDEYYNEFSTGLLSIDVLADEIPDELLGVEPGDPKATDKAKSMFIRLFNSRGNNRKKLQKQVDAFRKKAGDIPAVYYGELSLEENGSATYQEKLDRYAGMFPDYALIKIIFLTQQINSGDKNKVIPVLEKPFDLEFFFPGRKSIHLIELVYFISFNIFAFIRKTDASGMEALSQLLDEIDIGRKETALLQSTLMLNKIVYVAAYLEND